MQVPTSTRSLFGDAMLVAFYAAQLFDGVLTYLGTATFGAASEGNPLIGWYIAAFGAGVALIGAKGLAMMCAAILHLRAMHRTIGVLAIVYYGAAVLPWSRLLWP